MKIKDAIEESDLRNRIVDLDVRSIADAMTTIRDEQGNDGIDYIDTTDEYGRQMREIWSTVGSEREWRIHLHEE